ncbi:MAG: YSC84-related protein, partial [Planctomycetota bacterium]
GNLGIGLGAKEYRLLMIFNTESAMQKFLMGQWSFGGSAEASATDEGSGGSAAAAGKVMKEVETFQLTDAGAVIAATVTGGKFYKDKELN